MNIISAGYSTASTDSISYKRNVIRLCHHDRSDIAHHQLLTSQELTISNHKYKSSNFSL